MKKAWKPLMTAGTVLLLLAGCASMEEAPIDSSLEVEPQQEETSEPAVNIDQLHNGGLSIHFSKPDYVPEEGTLTVEFTAINKTNEAVRLGDVLFAFWENGEPLEAGMKSVVLSPDEKREMTISRTSDGENTFVDFHLLSGKTEDATTESLVLMLE